MSKATAFKSRVWLVALLLPACTTLQEIQNKQFSPLLEAAKRESAAFASKKLSAEIARALGFTPLQALSRGDRSLSGDQRRDAATAEQLFLNHGYGGASANARAVRSASEMNAVIRHYEVLTEADIAAIEQAFQPALDRIQQEIDHPRPPGSIPVYPGEKRAIAFQGYCLDKGIAAPRTQEGFHLLPTSELLPADARPYYDGLLQYGQRTHRHNEVQGLIWRLVHGVNPEHEPGPLSLHEKQVLDEAVPGGSASFYQYLRNKYQQSQTSLNALYQKQARELVQDVVNRHVNPVFAGTGVEVSLYRRDLNGPAEVGDYLNRLAMLPVSGVAERGTEYTLLTGQVAARSVSTMDVRAMSIEIVNSSDQVYYYQPLDYIAISTLETQPVGHFPRDPGEEDDPRLITSVENVLQFLEENEQTLEYIGYALDAFLIIAGPGGIAIRVGIGAAAKYIAKHPGKLKELRDAFFKTKGKKWEGEVVPNPSKGKWVDNSGKILWPPKNGFAGTPKSTKLKPGTKIDRYGGEDGVFTAPSGTPYTQRSLAPGSNLKPLTEYEVVKPIDALSGKTAPWFGEAGGGTQYQFNKTIRDLLEEGFIKRIP